MCKSNLRMQKHTSAYMPMYNIVVQTWHCSCDFKESKKTTHG